MYAQPLQGLDNLISLGYCRYQLYQLNFMLCYRPSFLSFLSGSICFVLKGTGFGVCCWSVYKAVLSPATDCACGSLQDPD